MVELRLFHWLVENHGKRYLCGTVGYGLKDVLGDEVKLQGYIDSDWTGSAVDRKSTLGCCFSFDWL